MLRPKYRYNAHNRLKDDGTYTYQYDKEGNRIRRTQKSGLGANSYTQYTYDHRNRLVAVQYFDMTGAPGTRVDYQYDSEGRLVTRSRNELGMVPSRIPKINNILSIMVESAC
jgi:YD repeat-containing protein